MKECDLRRVLFLWHPLPEVERICQRCREDGLFSEDAAVASRVAAWQAKGHTLDELTVWLLQRDRHGDKRQDYRDAIALLTVKLRLLEQGMEAQP